MVNNCPPPTIRKRTVLTLPLLALALILGLSPLSVNGLHLASAKAAPASCTGTCLNGTDPQTTGCGNDAWTVQYANIYNGSTLIGEVENRWSGSCSTNWTRGNQYIGCGHLSCINSWFVALAWHDSHGICQSWTYNGTANVTPFWTNQEYAPNFPTESYEQLKYSSDTGDYSSAYTLNSGWQGLPCFSN